MLPIKKNESLERFSNLNSNIRKYITQIKMVISNIFIYIL